MKIDISHLNEAQKTHLKMLFVEAKWLYNDALTFMNEYNMNDYDTATHTVHGFDKDKQPVTHGLLYLGSQMGIKTTITTSDGKKYKVLIEESERIKRCQRLIARRKKGSSNQYKARKLLQRAYQRLTSRKRDIANKIEHELLEHEHVYMICRTKISKGIKKIETSTRHET